MKKSSSAIYLCMLIAISVNLSKAHAQKMIFCDSISDNKIAGQSSVFNIDDQSKIITVLIYSSDKPFSTTKVVLKFYEIIDDSVEHYLTKMILDLAPNSRAYWRKLPFSSPNHYKIKAYTLEGNLFGDEKLAITAFKKPTGNARPEAVLNEIIKFYPNEFKNITGDRIGNDMLWRNWESTENLPGYDIAFISSEGIERKYWETTIIETADSTEALNKYNEIAKMINQIKFDCCVFNNEEEYSDPKYTRSKTTTWMPVSLNPGKDSVYIEMPLQLNFSYPLPHYKEYSVKLNIGFRSVLEKLSYTVKKNLKIK